jgi:tetratricopeptide (TPR) repeat protein/tRNA A-37 threonylcarbamoyl transferase component Bud32
MAIDFQRFQSVFQAVAELPAAERAAVLERECAGDTELRRRVEALLKAHDDSGELPAAPTEPTAACAPAVEPGQVFAGRYKLREKLGEGGMGVVFVADQSAPVQRRVALKVIRAGLDTRRLLARFEQERQALALMDHPNIAKVFDAGVDEGQRPYFAMELVKGLPLTRYCDDARLSPRERLELFIPVCQAVQHAHQKGIIHRDLKPSNILVGLYDGQPVPKVIDFGVAKATGPRLTQQTIYTEVGSIIGSLEYMSPEQAELNNLDIDTRSDVYALGVILYELLTGGVPFSRKELENADLAEMLRVIKEKEPPRPSTKLSHSDTLPSIAAHRHMEPHKLTALVRGELDWIVMKALEKDRGRRYESATGLAMDVQRYLAGEPVLAAPASRWYRLRKFVRRHRGPVLAAVVVLVTLLTGMAGTTWGLARAEEQRQLAEDKTEEAVAERDAKDIALKAKQRALADETRARQQAFDALVAKDVALKAKHQALADETKARHQAFDALRTMTAEFVERKFAEGAVLTDDDRAFLRSVIAQFDAFATIKGDDADSREVRSEGRFRVGNMRCRLGEFKEAEKDYDEALTVQKQLVADFPARPDFRQYLAATHNNRGNLLHAAGRLKEAEKDYDQALSIRKQLVADFRARPEFRHELARSHNNRGNLLRETGRTKEAVQDFDQALIIFNELAADFRARPEFRQYLAATHNNRSLLLLGTGRLKEAEEDLDQALSIQKQLVEDFHSRPDFRQELATSHNNRGNLLRATGRLEEAKEEHDQALSIHKQLAADFPARPEYRAELADSHNNRGALLRTMGRLQEAEKDHDQALSIQKKLAAEFLSRPMFRLELAVSYNDRGSLVHVRGLLKEAEKDYDEARSILQQLAADFSSDFPGRPEFRRELARSHNNWGNLLSDTSRLKEAEKEYDQALSILKQLAADLPNQSGLQNDLAWTYLTMAALQAQQSNLVAAKRLLLEGRPHHLAALKASPLHPDYRQYYRHYLGVLTGVQTGLLESEDAVRAAETCRDLGWNPPADAYAAACFLSQSVIIVAGHEKLNGKQRKEAIQFYGDAAMRLLRDAVSKGYKDVAHMKKDDDLAPLRSRQDFQKLVAELEGKRK